MRYFRLLLALSCISLLASTCTVEMPPSTDEVIAVINGTLIDGRGGEPILNAVVLIRGDRILRVGPKNKVTIPDQARIIDAGGGTILPGFINAHVHEGYDENHLQAWARGGVTTVRDESILDGRSLSELITWRASISGNPANARLVSAGTMISVPDGYGGLTVSSPEEARQSVIQELNDGADIIKISMEDGYAGTSGLPKLNTEELAAIISTAHERKVLVSGHITQAAYLKIIVEAGVDDAAHLAWDPIPVETLILMVKKDIYLIPTFTVFRNYGASSGSLVQNLKNFLKEGGKVALGNDYGGGPGEFELGIPMYEVQMMARAGMTPMQIITACTLNAAHVVGLEKEIGSLQAGKYADVLIISGNPIEDLESLANVQMVIHNGSIIYP